MCLCSNVYWQILLSRYRLIIWSFQINQHLSMLSTLVAVCVFFFVFYQCEYSNKEVFFLWNYFFYLRALMLMKATMIQSEIVMNCIKDVVLLFGLSSKWKKKKRGGCSFYAMISWWRVWPVLIFKPMFGPRLRPHVYLLDRYEVKTNEFEEALFQSVTQTQRTMTEQRHWTASSLPLLSHVKCCLLTCRLCWGFDFMSRLVYYSVSPKRLTGPAN